MLERPTLADGLIIAQLCASYGLSVQTLEFLPVGNDARAWSFRVEAASGLFFLKLRRGRVNMASLLVPRYLAKSGNGSVAAPIPAKSGRLYARISDNADFALTLYPYITGESRWNMSLKPAQWRDWGRIMRSIHDASLPPELARDVPHDVFALKWLYKIKQVEEALERGDHKGEAAAAVAQLWRDKAGLIDQCRSRYLALGAQLASRAPHFVICHADIHSANIIVDRDSAIHIVDWDETLLAPKERDLMFFIDDGRSAETTEAFFAGYGDPAVDWLALAYYKYDWVIQEFGDYGERVFLSPDQSDGNLALARREFARLFETGDVIDRAQRAYVNFLSAEDQAAAKTD